MVEVNAKKQEFTIKVQGDYSELVLTQAALIDLMKCYNFTDFGNSAGKTFYYALNLLEASLPDEDQQGRGYITTGKHVELPENLTARQTVFLSQALQMIENPEDLKQKNAVYEALKSVEK